MAGSDHALPKPDASWLADRFMYELRKGADLMTFCRGDGRCEICDPPTRQDPDEIEDET